MAARKSSSDFRLASPFTDHMVLQRGLPVPVWGWAKAGTKVTAELAGVTAETTAGKDGKWMIKLPPLDAGGPYELEVSGSEKIKLTDVMMGDVWVCSGQSNMEWPLQKALERADEVNLADYPNIRLFTVPRTAKLIANQEITTDWQRCTPESAGGFSAVAYYFGRELHRKTGVAIGLINTSWGGTIAEAWTSREWLASDPIQGPVLAEFEKSMKNPGKSLKKQLDAITAWNKKYGHNNKNNIGFPKGWHKPDYNDGDWKIMNLPQTWQAAGHKFSGTFWFRREVEVPADWKGKELTISLGAV
ncbi:MAG: sialate O-acetylesterase, partial [Planctomycetes bacterium]|nr:sialate O-acetylesterase [Planctomycetota bacterium]